MANDGHAPTSGPVSFTADLPPGLAAVSISAPSGWSCTVSTATCVTAGKQARASHDGRDVGGSSVTR